MTADVTSKLAQHELDEFWQLRGRAPAFHLLLERLSGRQPSIVVSQARFGSEGEALDPGAPANCWVARLAIGANDGFQAEVQGAEVRACLAAHAQDLRREETSEPGGVFDGGQAPRPVPPLRRQRPATDRRFRRLSPANSPRRSERCGRERRALTVYQSFGRCRRFAGGRHPYRSNDRLINALWRLPATLSPGRALAEENILKMRSILTLCATLALSTTIARAEGVKAAVFDCQLANLAQQPPTDADNARLPHVSDLLRQKLQESGRFDIVPITPQVKAEVDKASELRSCGGCAVDFAKQLDAKLAVTCQIQKVSNLILNINVYMKDVASDKPEQAYSVDIRGDNDLSFDHGVKYIVKHNILKE